MFNGPGPALTDRSFSVNSCTGSCKYQWRNKNLVDPLANVFGRLPLYSEWRITTIDLIFIIIRSILNINLQFTTYIIKLLKIQKLIMCLIFIQKKVNIILLGRGGEVQRHYSYTQPPQYIPTNAEDTVLIRI